jgi:hypothetical protein
MLTLHLGRASVSDGRKMMSRLRQKLQRWGCTFEATYAFERGPVARASCSRVLPERRTVRDSG